MRKIAFIISFLFPLFLWSQSISEQIDIQQARIDEFDGIKDNKVTLAFSNWTSEANLAYFTLIDNLQDMLFIDAVPMETQRLYGIFLVQELLEVNEYNYREYKPFQKLFGQVYKIFTNKYDEEKLNNTVFKDKETSIKCLPLIRKYDVTYELLKPIATKNPKKLFQLLPTVKKYDYALPLVERASIEDPVSMKTYYTSSNHGVKSLLSASDNDTIKQIIDVYNTYGKSSKAYALLDAIYSKELTIEEANKMSKKDIEYFSALLYLSTKEEKIAEKHIEDELEFYALRQVREINALHDASYNERFGSVLNVSPEVIYTLMVYSEEEIFTSSFIGMYDELIKDLSEAEMNGFDLIKSMGFNRFRTFIKMCANYNKLEDFLAHMGAGHKTQLLTAFISDISGKDALRKAVDVAGSITSIDDQEILTIFEFNLEKSYRKAEANNDREAQIIYGILSKFFQLKFEGEYASFFDTIAPMYPVPPVEVLSHKSLSNSQNMNVQVHYFYDDEDGITSYNTFINTFNKPGWTTVDKGTFVIVKAEKPAPVYILANKWNHEYDGHEDIHTYLKENKLQPHVIVHRGHSYYAGITIDYIPESANLVLLGSCGGYHNLTDVLEHSPTAHIISSKQIGTLKINNPLSFALAEEMRKGNDIVWDDIWKRVDQNFAPGTYAQEKFDEYIPPNKNLGALFIQAYNNLLGVN